MEIASHHYFKALLSRLWAFLLLIIFMNGILSESLHHHVQQQFGNEKSAPDALNKQFNAAKFKCKLCDLLKHHSPFFNPPLAQSPVPAPVMITNMVMPFTVAPPLPYIFSYTNKGPPHLYA